MVGHRGVADSRQHLGRTTPHPERRRDADDDTGRTGEIQRASDRIVGHPGDRAAEADSAARLIDDLAKQLAAGQVEPPSVSAFSEEALAGRYRDTLEGLAG